MSANPPDTPAQPMVVTATWALAGLAFTMLLSSLSTSIANVGLPTLAEAFDTSFQAVQWVVLAYLLAITALVVIAGRLGDLVGRRRLLLAGIAIFTAASMACGSVDDLGWLISARALQGSGAALMMAMTTALVGETVAKARIGRAMGMLGTMSAVGTTLGPSLGGVLIAGWGWPAIFLINVPLGLVAIALVYRFLPGDRVTSGVIAFDFSGAALLTVVLVAYALAMTLGRGSFGVVNLACMSVALSGLAMFVIVESRSPAPLVEPTLFRGRAMRSGFTTSVLATTVAMTTLVIGPFYLTIALGLGAAETGMVMATGPLVAALVGVPAGMGVDRWGAGRLVLVGLGAMVLGCCALALVSPALGAWAYLVPLILLTSGFATFQAANNTAVLAAADPSQRGVTSGLLSLSRNLGLITGASTMGAVFVSATGAVDLSSADGLSVTSGTHAAFGVAAVLVAGAWIVAITTPRRLQASGV